MAYKLLTYVCWDFRKMVELRELRYIPLFANGITWRRQSTIITVGIERVRPCYNFNTSRFSTMVIPR